MMLGITTLGWLVILPVTLVSSFFQPLTTKAPTFHTLRTSSACSWNSKLHSTPLSTDSENSPPDSSQLPQVFATGYSTNPDLLLAITQAVTAAVHNLPPPPPHLAKNDNQIDVAFLTISSLYDNQSIPMTTVVPTLLTTAMNLYGTVKNVVGSTAGGIISWQENLDSSDSDNLGNNIEIVESEGALGVSVTLALLPDVELKAFHVEEEDVPDEAYTVPVNSWKSTLKLQNWNLETPSDGTNGNDGAFFLIPSPAFQTTIDDLLEGFKYAYPQATVFGGLASTVSSLSRARLFLYKQGDSTAEPTVYNNGCIGIGFKGDIGVQILVAQGAKPVGGVYKIVDGEKSTIRVIVGDEDFLENNDDNSDQLEEEMDKKANWKKMYEKALIPKPPLAEANQIIKNLSDDNAAFMRKALLIGLEQGGNLGRTPNELERLKNGEGHSYLVRQVASAGMKDGSVTLPLESVSVQKGGRMRFFVRDSAWCKKEVEAIWCGYKKNILQETFDSSDSNDEEAESTSSFSPSGCFMISTMDRGTKLFGSNTNTINPSKGFESNEIRKYLPTVNSISGFYGNGVLAGLDGSFLSKDRIEDVIVHGSASCYVVFGSKSNRPIFNAAARKTQQKKDLEQSNIPKTKSVSPRKENGELILKRRDVHSGRALSVSTVEWSVAEKNVQPTSVLEGYMWDKETEVDRFRERVPLPNLLSQVKLAMSDPSKHSPRNWVAKVKEMAMEKDDGFAIIPECKRTDVTVGSLRDRYDAAKLAEQFVKDGNAKALSVNCDGVLFGGSLDDIETVRKACGENIPILASDLLLYPYQLYKLRLAGADAVYLVAAALEPKDFSYLTKIAKSLNLQTVISVTSEVQIQSLSELLSPGSIDCLILSNRNLETYEFDESGEQAFNMIASATFKEFKEKHGDDVLILVEGRIGMANLGQGYIKKLKTLGANGAIVGQGLAELSASNGGEALKSFRKDESIFE